MLSTFLVSLAIVVIVYARPTSPNDKPAVIMTTKELNLAVSRPWCKLPDAYVDGMSLDSWEMSFRDGVPENTPSKEVRVCEHVLLPYILEVQYAKERTWDAAKKTEKPAANRPWCKLPDKYNPTLSEESWGRGFPLGVPSNTTHAEILACIVKIRPIVRTIKLAARTLFEKHKKELKEWKEKAVKAVKAAEAAAKKKIFEAEEPLRAELRKKQCHLGLNIQKCQCEHPDKWEDISAMHKEDEKDRDIKFRNEMKPVCGRKEEPDRSNDCDKDEKGEKIRWVKCNSDGWMPEWNYNDQHNNPDPDPFPLWAILATPSATL
jgi:hypothetical protein